MNLFLSRSYRDRTSCTCTSVFVVVMEINPAESRYNETIEQTNFSIEHLPGRFEQTVSTAVRFGGCSAPFIGLCRKKPVRSLRRQQNVIWGWPNPTVLFIRERCCTLQFEQGTPIALVPHETDEKRRFSALKTEEFDFFSAFGVRAHEENWKCASDFGARTKPYGPFQRFK